MDIAKKNKVRLRKGKPQRVFFFVAEKVASILDRARRMAMGKFGQTPRKLS
jgi:hypothetical protein